MKKYNNKLLAIGIAIVGIIVLLSVGLTYAFFTANIEGNENANQTVITTADLRLVFNDTDILSLDNALPGISASKTFTVTNIGNVRQRYDINITNVINEFVDDELVYTITSDNEDGGEVLETSMPTEESTLLTSSIDPGITITYEITVKFKETGTDQNENQGASFSGKLKIASRIMGVALGGYVYDENDNALSDVTVELNSDPIITTTNEEGYYEIEDAPIGNHIIYIKQGETVLGSKEVTFLSSVEPEIKNNSIYLPDKVVKYVNIKVESELNIYLKDKSLTVMAQILKDNIALSDESVNFDSIEGNGLYYTADIQYGEDDERIYYYRGRVDNNWVTFGGYLWRIVRTTSEEGIKLVYSGDGTTDTSAFIGVTTAFNTNNNNKHYVGYTYNTSGYTTLPQTDSKVKTEVDNWYDANLKAYESYLSTTAIYCADRSSEREIGDYIYYPAYNRIKCSRNDSLCYGNAVRPTYACPSVNGSRYTVSTETGNGYLTNPVALLTADEIVYAGVGLDISNLNLYITDNANGNPVWTLSPYTFSPTYSDAYVWGLNSSGSFIAGGMSYNFNVRPVVTLKSDTLISRGAGTQENPYIIK